MKWLNNITIRYKLLLLLIALPSAILATYLYVATETVRADKLTYITDSSMAVSRSAAAQTRAEFVALLNLFKPLSYEALYKGHVGEASELLFQSDPLFNAFIIYKVQGSNYFQSDLKEKSKDYVAHKMENQKAWNAFLDRTNKNGYGVMMVFNEDTIILGQRIKSASQDDGMLFIAFYQIQDLISRFGGRGDYKQLLINLDGKILIGADNSSDEIIENLKKSNLLSEFGNSNLNLNEVSRTITNKAKQLKMNSIVKVGFADLAVVSIVDQSVALAAIKVLWQESILFFIIMISVTVVISLLASKKLVAYLLELHEASMSIASGNFKIKVPIRSKDEVGHLAQSFNDMANEIDRLFNEMVHKTRMEGELKTAKTVQETFFPEPLFNLKNLEVAGNFRPATECGGDWWYYFKVDNKLYILLTDATGHGVPAALMTSAARSVSIMLERNKYSPQEALALMNYVIYQVSKGKMMMTGCLVCIDEDTGDIDFCNASHDPPILIPNKSELSKGDLNFLQKAAGLRLGQSPDSTYPVEKIKLNPGETLLLYTDGVYEFVNSKGAYFKERDFIKAILKGCSEAKTAETILNSIKQQMDEFNTKTEVDDDVTMVVIKWRE